MTLFNSLFRTLAVAFLCAFLIAAPGGATVWGGGSALAADGPPVLDDMALEAEENDPLEGFNRFIFGFNRLIDTWFLKPAAVFYKDILPPPLTTALGNALNNLRTPIILLNDLLQGEGDRAGTTIARFGINTTVGVLGLGDPATGMGFPRHTEDFGQTLAVWGLEGGPYLMLPIIGPSNPRDTVGLVVDFLVDPINLWAHNADKEGVIYARTALTAVDARATHFDALEEMEKGSLDFYATVRSLYRQRRADEIGNGREGYPAAPGLTRLPDEVVAEFMSATATPPTEAGN